MIEYDYVIERDEGDIRKIYKPEKIKSPLPNIVYIEAPNSTGKSTLLHILALSMHGLKNGKINSSLTRKMESLMESDYQNLVFEVTLTNKDGSLKIKSKKKSFDKEEIEVFEFKNGKQRRLGSDLLNKEYELIYDIPDNPVERINQLANEISDIQKEYGHKISNLGGYIRGIINEAKSSYDLNKLRENDQEIESLINALNKHENENSEKESNLDTLEKYLCLKFYLHYSQMAYNTELRIKSLKPAVNNKFKKDNKENIRLTSLEKIANKKIEEMSNLYNGTIPLLKAVLPKEENDHLKVWEKINLHNSLIDLEFDSYLDKEITHFQKVLNNLNPKDRDESFIEAEVFQSLIEFLENYKETNILIPELNKTVPEFLDILKNANRKNEQKINLASNIEKVQKMLGDLLSNKQDIESNILSSVKKLRETLKNKDSNISSPQQLPEISLESYKKELKKYNEKCGTYFSKCIQKSIDQDNIINEFDKIESDYGKLYSSYTEEQLQNKINDLIRDINEIHQKIDKLTTRISIKQKENDDLRQKKPHEYYSKINEMSKLQNKCLKLGQKMEIDFEKYIKLIKDSNTKGFEKESKINSEIVVYCESVFKYLARRLSTVRHIDQIYELEKVDLLNKALLTKSGKRINLLDMGTGQSQSAFLLGLLNKNSNKPVIALFDEVAMMDNKSLDPIYKKFNEMFDQGQLLAGVVVQKGEAVKIESKEW